MPQLQETQSRPSAQGCAPGCGLAFVFLGCVLAAAAITLKQGLETGRVTRNWAPYLLESSSANDAQFQQEVENARAADRVLFATLASLAYLLIYWGALEYWNARRPEPTAFGRRLSELGHGASVNARGGGSWGHPLRNARYALPVAAGVLGYDAAFAWAAWAWSLPPAFIVLCALAAAPFHVTALVNLHGYFAARVVRAALQTPLKADPAGNLLISYRLEARRDTEIALQVILLGIDAHFPPPRILPSINQVSTTQRLDCIHSSAVVVWPTQPLKAGEHRAGQLTLRLPSPRPKPKGKLLWFVALAAAVPHWPDFEIVEPVETN